MFDYKIIIKIFIMENCVSTDDLSKINGKRSNSRDSTGSLHKSSKILEKKASNSSTNFKSENDVNQESCEKNFSEKTTPDVYVKVPHKFIANWKKACDHTRDKTKDFLKRWRTLPEFDVEESKQQINTKTSGWSVHVWSTWVDRMSVNNSSLRDNDTESILTPTQCDKLSHFFKCLLDHDNDDIISSRDFQALSERLRHFADWSTNSVEFNILKQVEEGFTKCFLKEYADEKLGFKIRDEFHVSLDGWFLTWSEILHHSKSFKDFPLWLQYFVKVLFHSVNRSGSGIILKNELENFYSSVLLLSLNKVKEIIDTAYQAMTSNGDYALTFNIYQMCFTNFLLGRFPHGCGQYFLGYFPSNSPALLFPVDYSALNAQPEDLEQYLADNKTNRRSVIV